MLTRCTDGNQEIQKASASLSLRALRLTYSYSSLLRHSLTSTTMAIAAATMATHAAHGSPQPASAADSVDSDSAASDDQDSEAEEKSGPEVVDSAAGSDEDSQASDEDESLDDSDEDDVASDSEASDESAGSDEEPASPAKPTARSLIAKPAAKKPTVSTGKAKRLRGGAGSEDEADASPTANTSSSKKGNTLRKKNRPQDPSPTTSVPSRSIPPSDGKLRKSRPGGTATGRPIGLGDVEDDGAGATGEEDPKRGSVKDRSDDATVRGLTPSVSSLSLVRYLTSHRSVLIPQTRSLPPLKRTPGVLSSTP